MLYKTGTWNELVSISLFPIALSPYSYIVLDPLLGY